MEQKILVVEDSRPFRRAIESELRQAGFLPVFAETIADCYSRPTPLETQMFQD